jgi:hypothetical protein
VQATCLTPPPHPDPLRPQGGEEDYDPIPSPPLGRRGYGEVGPAQAWQRADLPRSGISKALLGKLSVSRIRGKTIEKLVARDARHSFEMFDYLPESVLDFRKLVWIFDIIGNIRSHQLTVLDFDDHLSVLRYADTQSRKIGSSERSHCRIHRFFRIVIRHRVESIRPPRPLIVRISRSCRRECLKHFFQEEDKLISEGFLASIMSKRWTHILYPCQHLIGIVATLPGETTHRATVTRAWITSKGAGEGEKRVTWTFHGRLCHGPG